MANSRTPTDAAVTFRLAWDGNYEMERDLARHEAQVQQLLGMQQALGRGTLETADQLVANSRTAVQETRRVGQEYGRSMVQALGDPRVGQALRGVSDRLEGLGSRIDIVTRRQSDSVQRTAKVGLDAVKRQLDGVFDIEQGWHKARGAAGNYFSKLTDVDMAVKGLMRDHKQLQLAALGAMGVMVPKTQTNKVESQMQEWDTAGQRGIPDLDTRRALDRLTDSLTLETGGRAKREEVHQYAKEFALLGNDLKAVSESGKLAVEVMRDLGMSGGEVADTINGLQKQFHMTGAEMENYFSIMQQAQTMGGNGAADFVSHNAPELMRQLDSNKARMRAARDLGAIYQQFTEKGLDATQATQMAMQMRNAIFDPEIAKQYSFASPAAVASLARQGNVAQATQLFVEGFQQKLRSDPDGSFRRSASQFMGVDEPLLDIIRTQKFDFAGSANRMDRKKLQDVESGSAFAAFGRLREQAGSALTFLGRPFQTISKTINSAIAYPLDHGLRKWGTFLKQVSPWKQNVASLGVSMMGAFGLFKSAPWIAKTVGQFAGVFGNLVSKAASMRAGTVAGKGLEFLSRGLTGVARAARVINERGSFKATLEFMERGLTRMGRLFKDAGVSEWEKGAMSVAGGMGKALKLSENPWEVVRAMLAAMREAMTLPRMLSLIGSGAKMASGALLSLSRTILGSKFIQAVIVQEAVTEIVKVLSGPEMARALVSVYRLGDAFTDIAANPRKGTKVLTDSIVEAQSAADGLYERISKMSIFGIRFHPMMAYQATRNTLGKMLGMDMSEKGQAERFRKDAEYWSKYIGNAAKAMHGSVVQASVYIGAFEDAWKHLVDSFMTATDTIKKAWTTTVDFMEGTTKGVYKEMFDQWLSPLRYIIDKMEQFRSGEKKPPTAPGAPPTRPATPVPGNTHQAREAAARARMMAAMAAPAGARSPDQSQGNLDYHGAFGYAINRTAKKYGIDPFLLAGLIKQESSFNPNARPGINKKTGRRPSSAVGLGQFVDPTAEMMGIKGKGFDLRTDPNVSVDAIGRLLMREGYAKDPLGAVRRYHGDAKNPTVAQAKEAREYVPKVLAQRRLLMSKEQQTSIAAAVPSHLPASHPAHDQLVDLMTQQVKATTKIVASNEEMLRTERAHQQRTIQGGYDPTSRHGASMEHARFGS